MGETKSHKLRMKQEKEEERKNNGYKHLNICVHCPSKKKISFPTFSELSDHTRKQHPKKTSRVRVSTEVEEGEEEDTAKADGVLARILKASLVIPILKVNLIWGDESEFSDIFDVEHFKRTLQADVQVVSSLPSTHIIARQLPEAKIPHGVSPVWIRSRFFKQLNEEGVLVLKGLDSKLSKNLPPDLQKLRCKVAFHALEFAAPILELGNRLARRMWIERPYVAVHLRLEKDMWIRTGCRTGLGSKFDDIIVKLALQPLTTEFPNLVTKKMLAREGELSPFMNRSSALAAIHYIVSLSSDVFLASHCGNMGSAMQVAFHALKFTAPILELGNRLARRIWIEGPYVAVHLRLEKDVWIRTGCRTGLGSKFDDIIVKERESRPEFLTGGLIMSATQRRLAGFCPLEFARLLKCLGAPRSALVYSAGGEPFSGKLALQPLTTEFPNLMTKEMLAREGELSPFRSSATAAFDYIVSLSSDVGHSKYVKPNKRKMIPDSDLETSTSDSHEEFSDTMRHLHRGLQGQPLSRNNNRRGLDVIAYPVPECMCRR